MYATLPLSRFKSNPEAAAWQPPDGGNSGYLVVKETDDDDNDDCESCCLGPAPYNSTRVYNLPFPQNRVITVGTADGENNAANTVLFVPILDQPLSSNRYYPVIASGRRKGLVRACSRKEDTTEGWFGWNVIDVEPRPFDPADIYLQIEIVQRQRGQFTARAVAPDGFPYNLYRTKYWHAFASKPKNFDLSEALGINGALRSRQLTAPSALVGKWYCPFYLVKEDGLSPSEQMDSAAFYEVTLEQRWEPIRDDAISSRVLMGGSFEARQEVSSTRSSYGDGYVWFRSPATGQRMGVATTVWERMRWEQYMGGWVDDDTGWVPGRSVLVERFVVKRMDGSVAMVFDFSHINKITA